MRGSFRCMRLLVVHCRRLATLHWRLARAVLFLRVLLGILPFVTSSGSSLLLHHLRLTMALRRARRLHHRARLKVMSTRLV